MMDDTYNDTMTYDEQAMEDYHAGLIEFDELPMHIQQEMRDEWLWEQADAEYDAMMGEE